MEPGARGRVVWAVALGVAIVAVFAYEGVRSPLEGFGVTWVLGTEGPFTAEGTVKVDETFPFPLELVSRNITSVTVELSWTDDAGDPDTFELVVDGPGELHASGQGSEGTLVVTVPVGAAPSATRLSATDREAARHQADASYASDKGVGRWDVQVHLVEAPGLRPVPGVEAQPDGANDFAVVLTAEAYRAELARA